MFSKQSETSDKDKYEKGQFPQSSHEPPALPLRPLHISYINNRSTSRCNATNFLQSIFSWLCELYCLKKLQASTLPRAKTSVPVSGTLDLDGIRRRGAKNTGQARGKSQDENYVTKIITRSNLACAQNQSWDVKKKAPKSKQLSHSIIESVVITCNPTYLELVFKQCPTNLHYKQAFRN